MGGLLESAEKERMIQGIIDELKRKKVGFSGRSGLKAPELRDKLQRLFTSIVIKEANVELADMKEAIEKHLEEISTNLEKRNEFRD